MWRTIASELDGSLEKSDFLRAFDKYFVEFGIQQAVDLAESETSVVRAGVSSTSNSQAMQSVQLIHLIVTCIPRALLSSELRARLIRWIKGHSDGSGLPGKMKSWFVASDANTREGDYKHARVLVEEMVAYLSSHCEKPAHRA